MPNYEPTPRRFSVISVSRSASRRNSIDDIARPNLAPATPGLPPASSPIDLASALKQLQHVETEGEAERGRARHTGLGRAHDGAVAAPSARRESSASTRDRIAMWEERSRSQSKGRSKSRGRDVGPRSRISVVPEIPELSAAFAAFREEEDSTTGASGRKPEETQVTALGTIQGASDEMKSPVSTERINQPGQEVLERTRLTVASVIKDEDDRGTKDQAQRSKDSQDESAEAPQLIKTEPEDPGIEKAEPADVHQPHTPIYVVPEHPRTPETAPQTPQSNRTGEAPRDPSPTGGGPPTLWKVPRTPSPVPDAVRAARGAVMPITPEATPEQLVKRQWPNFAADEERAFRLEGSRCIESEPEEGYIAVLQSQKQPKDLPQKSSTTLPPNQNYHPSAELLNEDQVNQGSRLRKSKSNSRPASPSAILDKSSDGDGVQTRYHNVWRINSYQPDFPLPPRPSNGTNIRSPGDTRFDGDPLQGLPRSRLTIEAVSRDHIDGPNPYPCAREADTNDWVVNMPPSPLAAYAPTEQRVRPPPRSRSRNNQMQNGGRYMSRSDIRRHEWDAPPVIERALHAASVSMIQGLNVPVELYRGIRDTYYPPPGRPNIIKAYPIRRRLPVRIFFPSHHDLTSPALLPTLFTVHGGAFTFGSPADDDNWNRAFSDTYTVLIISLNYAKSPWAAFPSPLLDLEALYHAVLNDESLPIDRMRTALAGFDAGANLALALCQLPSVKSGRDPHPHPSPPPHTASNSTLDPATTVRSNPPPAGVVAVCGILDFTAPVADKLGARPYKRSLRAPRGWGPGLDWMGRLLPSSAWSYIPYGHDASDPLLSPAYAERKDLPPHVFVVAAELDCLANESWRAVSKWAGRGKRVVPGRREPVGRREVSLWRGCLDDGRGEDRERFAWEEVYEGDGMVGSTKWLLVPDVVHGFDSAGWRGKYLWADEIARMDAEMKTIAYQREVAEWLWRTVWR
ncbi:Arylacetamide deacetylase [Madurella mycetomatis]|uniref:Arylacetamide deacetylase n=1 Tax=Madurella mycetomatis TaxID=100816 RepID=A0A175VU36_9PEZI|nr:Arylacetamide deacetylase [Madurella mycetomatis]